MMHQSGISNILPGYQTQPSAPPVQKRVGFWTKVTRALGLSIDPAKVQAKKKFVNDHFTNQATAPMSTQGLNKLQVGAKSGTGITNEVAVDFLDRAISSL